MSVKNKPGLVLFYDHFYPAYKAGGPIQSLTNLAISLQDDYRVFVFTSAYDLHEKDVLPGIRTNCWTDVKLPLSTGTIKVWYATAGQTGSAILRQAIKEADADFMYLNGMFSLPFVLLPLHTLKNKNIIICPRGMLQQGALAGKALKKKIFLAALKLSGLCKKLTWHATNEEEATDIKRVFGNRVKIIVAGNIPKKPLGKFVACSKTTGELRLVYLSLITEKKNLLTLINIVSALEANLSLDVYGPVKDEAYWDKCKEAIAGSKGKVEYKGDVQPVAVQEVFGMYDASILLTKGENFGHALYESLSAGRPIITSHFTPWNNLLEKNAGWNVDINDVESIREVLNTLCQMDNQAFEFFCNGARLLSLEYFNRGFSPEQYKILFS